MNARELLVRIFKLKWSLDLAAPEDCAYIQKQIDEQMEALQCIVPEPIQSLTRVINKRYSDWLDGKFPELTVEGDQPDKAEGD